VNHRECNPLLESDRLDPSMDMYFLFNRLRCEYLTDCSAQLSHASASGYETSGHGNLEQHGHVIVIVNGHPCTCLITVFSTAYRAFIVRCSSPTSMAVIPQTPGEPENKSLLHASAVPGNSNISKYRFCVMFRTPQ
jgi:hypothetical protein